MNGLPYYKRYPRDFIEGTVGMTFEMKAAYGFVLDLIYMHGGKLPDDERYISGLLSLSTRRWRAVRDGLISAGKIAASDGIITNERAVFELENLAEFSEKQRKKRLGINKNKNLREPQLNHTDTDTEERPKGLSRRASAQKKSDLDLIREAFEHA